MKFGFKIILLALGLLLLFTAIFVGVGFLLDDGSGEFDWMAYTLFNDRYLFYWFFLK